jgi:DNA-binding NtrC family response regulator
MVDLDVGAMTEHEDTFEDSGSSHHPEVLPLLPHLFVVLECDRPMSGGARYALDGVEVVVIGRGSERSATRGFSGGVSELVVHVPGRSMSSTHARLLWTSEGWVLEDAHSTNGTFVGGKRVTRQRLEDGDFFELGHTIFLLRTAIATPSGTAITFDSAKDPPPAEGLTTLLPALSKEYSALARFARSDLTILFLGETGTGKEVLARAVHEMSGRPGRFVAVNCGALPSNLVESQLFGHVRGSFSGANRDAPGAFLSANKGTLLLDEIGDLPEPAQAALLRVLQEREVVPVGGTRPISVDLRIIAATHRPLQTLVEQQRFRADLFARLDGYRFHLPKLEHRHEDLGLIVADVLVRNGATAAHHFVPDAGLALATHHWPFNIRELVQHLKRALISAGGASITKSDLSLENEASASRARPPTTPKRALSLAEMELKEELVKMLKEHRGNVAGVARAMGKARMQIQRWITRFQVEPTSFRGRTTIKDE